MSLPGILFKTLVYATGLLLDFVALLLVIHAVCRKRVVPVLSEFNEAGRPLIDRTLKRMEDCWHRLVPGRPLSPNRLLILTWLVITLLRGCLAMLL